MKNEKTNKTAYFNAISCNSANIQARVPFFFKWVHYLEIKSKNTSKVERDFDEDFTLSGSLPKTDQYHVFIYIRVNE